MHHPPPPAPRLLRWALQCWACRSSLPSRRWTPLGGWWPRCSAPSCGRCKRLRREGVCVWGGGGSAGVCGGGRSHRGREGVGVWVRGWVGGHVWTRRRRRLTPPLPAASAPPQVIRPALLREGFELVAREGLEVTDDVSIIEAMGLPVQVTPGSYTNIKVGWVAWVGARVRVGAAQPRAALLAAAVCAREQWHAPCARRSPPPRTCLWQKSSCRRRSNRRSRRWRPQRDGVCSSDALGARCPLPPPFCPPLF